MRAVHIYLPAVRSDYPPPQGYPLILATQLHSFQPCNSTTSPYITYLFYDLSLNFLLTLLCHATYLHGQPIFTLHSLSFVVTRDLLLTSCILCQIYFHFCPLL